MQVGDWQDQSDGTKAREVSMNLTLTHPMGPKNSQITESQVRHGINNIQAVYGGESVTRFVAMAARVSG